MTDTPDLIFEEPPAPETKRRGPTPGDTDIGRWLTALRSHPGRSAKYHGTISPPIGTRIRKGTLYGVKAGEFKVVTRKIEGSTRVTMWATYLGEPQP